MLEYGQLKLIGLHRDHPSVSEKNNFYHENFKNLNHKISKC